MIYTKSIFSEPHFNILQSTSGSSIWHYRSVFPCVLYAPLISSYFTWSPVSYWVMKRDYEASRCVIFCILLLLSHTGSGIVITLLSNALIRFPPLEWESKYSIILYFLTYRLSGRRWEDNLARAFCHYCVIIFNWKDYEIEVNESIFWVILTSFLMSIRFAIFHLKAIISEIKKKKEI
jgi:hypothetical protein